MGQVVLHLDKAKGTDSAMSAHIERTITPKNVHPEKTYLNKELIEFPKGVENRHQAIQYRLDNAGLTRKIGTNQVRAIRIMLSGSPDSMKNIEAEGKLDSWCRDNLKWLYTTYGKENIVSAVLHMDETTPHIHATLVPIVTGERRKAKQENTTAKKKYKRKSSQASRLCADDVMARDKLKEYQDTYAKAMAKYGLERGIEGSKANHITAQQYNRELTKQNTGLQVDLEELQKRKEQADKELSNLKSNIKTEKLKSTAVDVGSNIMEGIGSLIGTSKVKKLQQEAENLKAEKEAVKEDLTIEINALKSQIGRQDKAHAERMDKQKTQYTDIINKLKAEREKMIELVPLMKEYLKIDTACRQMGFNKNQVIELLNMKPQTVNGTLYSAEHRKSFKAERTVVKVEKDVQQNGKLLLNLDGMEYQQWFKTKHAEALKMANTNSKQRSTRMRL